MHFRVAVISIISVLVGKALLLRQEETMFINIVIDIVKIADQQFAVRKVLK